MLTSADRNLYSHFYAKCGVWGHKMWHERVQLLSRKLAQYEHFVIAENEFSFSLVKYLTFSKSTHLARRLVIAENCRFWGRVRYNPSSLSLCTEAAIQHWPQNCRFYDRRFVTLSAQLSQEKCEVTFNFSQQYVWFFIWKALVCNLACNQAVCVTRFDQSECGFCRVIVALGKSRFQSYIL